MHTNITKPIILIIILIIPAVLGNFSLVIYRLLNRYNSEAQKYRKLIAALSWNFTINLNNANEEKLKNATLEKELFDNNWKIRFLNYKHKLHLIDSYSLGLILKIPYNPSIQNVASLNQYKSSKRALLKAYANIRLMRKSFTCPYNFNPALPPYTVQYMRLTCSWEQHRIGPELELKNLYAKMAKSYAKCCSTRLSNGNGPNFAPPHIEDIIRKIKPFYTLLHAYTRDRLQKYYHLQNYDMIPLQLTENAWGQNWEGVTSKIFPIKSMTYKTLVDTVIRTNNFSIEGLTINCEDYYNTINFPKLPQQFWKNSIFSHTKNANLSSCYPSAWNMFNNNDFRIMFCQKVSLSSWSNLYHELGHVYYYMAYKNLPVVLRMSPNLALHESIGDTIALSALSPWNLIRYGFPNTQIDKEQEMEFLLLQALKKIPLFMFAYSLEDWRSQALSGNLNESHYNSAWWALVAKYQGLSPPISRSEENFDPAFKFHVIKNQNFLEYLQSTVIQFQLFKALCSQDRKNAKVPLHKCDLKGSKRAGDILWNIMKLGNQITWQDALFSITGKSNYDVEPLLDYFKPLITHLETIISQNKIKIGWSYRKQFKNRFYRHFNGFY